MDAALATIAVVVVTAMVVGVVWIPRLRDLPGEHVPDGSLVVLGDNPSWSVDSRQLGLFPADRLLGVLVRQPAPPPAVRGVPDAQHGPPGNAGRAT